MDRMTAYLTRLKGKVFKLLPLREEEDSGKAVYLSSYLNHLAIEAEGAATTFQMLDGSQEYTDIINTLHYFEQHNVDFKVYRRETLKVLNIIDHLITSCGGDMGGD